jgi:hypothetical protein
MVTSPATEKNPLTELFEHIALLASGAFVVGFIYVNGMRFLKANPIALTAFLTALLFALVYVVVLNTMERYDPTWKSPAMTDDMNMPLRKQFSLGLGLAVVTLSSVLATFFIKDAALRAVVLLQSVVMAVSAANDFRRFRIPLPLTVVGLGLAVIALILSGAAWWVFALAFVWGFGLNTLHTVLSKNSMGLGDHLATIWIALASPFNGILPIVIGQLILHLVAKFKGWDRKRLPVGGAWLIAAAAILTVPPFPALLANSATPSFASFALPPNAHMTNAQLFANAEFDGDDLRTFARYTREVGYVTAMVSFEPNRDERIVRAREASLQLKQLGEYMATINIPSANKMPTLHTIDRLSVALANYDVETVRVESLELAHQRDRLSDLTKRYEAWQTYLKTFPNEARSLRDSQKHTAAEFKHKEQEK